MLQVDEKDFAAVIAKATSKRIMTTKRTLDAVYFEGGKEIARKLQVYKRNKVEQVLYYVAK